MQPRTGYLVIADLSGYTAYLTSSEQEHASSIIRSLLSAIVEQVGDPLHLLKIEGDAVLAYSDRPEFPTGETFLGICENIYNSFATRRRDIIANTTCRCRACANVQDLDLKILAHHGQFELIEIGPMKDISGADVILVHRMAKTDVKEATGIHSYAMFSEAAARAMNVDAALVPYSQTFEHFGEVGMQIYDLARAWDKFRSRQERHFLEEKDGIFTFRRVFPFTPGVLWEGLVTPDLKRQWMGMLSVDTELPEGRIGPGAGYHCVHDDAEFRYWITDWVPFEYFSDRITDDQNPGVFFPETYALMPVEGGTELRHTLGPARDENGERLDAARQEEVEQEAVEFLQAFWPPSFDALEKLLRESG